jgi:hypothetical protein
VWAFPTIAVSGGDSINLMKPEVVLFLDNAKACEHFAGEWDPELTRKEKRVIERNVDKYCGFAQKQRRLLLKTYGHDGAVLQVLNQYESVVNYSPAK